MKVRGSGERREEEVEMSEGGEDVGGKCGTYRVGGNRGGGGGVGGGGVGFFF